MAQNSFGSFMQGLATNFKPRAMMGGGDNIDPRLLTVIANAQFQKERLAQEMAMREQIANIGAQSKIDVTKQDAFNRYLLESGLSKRLNDPDPKKRLAAQEEFKQVYYNFFSGNIAPNMNEPVEPKKPVKGLNLFGWIPEDAPIRKAAKDFSADLKEAGQEASGDFETTGDPIADFKRMLVGEKKVKNKKPIDTVTLMEEDTKKRAKKEK